MKNVLLYLPIFTLIFFSCSDDRITPDSYSSANAFYELNKEEQQDFVITTDSGGPIIGKKGTELYGGRAILEHQDGSAVDLPWTAELIELYSIKDYMLYRFPTTGAAQLESGGIVSVTAVADGKPLKVKAGAQYPIIMSTSPTITGMGVFQGSGDSFISWTAATDGSTMTIDGNSKYALNLSTLGWQHPAQASFGTTTNITFTLPNGATGGEFIDLWVIPNNKHALFYGNNLVASNIPVGIAVKTIAIAVNQDGDFVLHNTDVTVTADMSIELNFNTKSEDELLATLEAL